MTDYFYQARPRDVPPDEQGGHAHADTAGRRSPYPPEDEAYWAEQGAAPPAEEGPLWYEDRVGRDDAPYGQGEEAAAPGSFAYPAAEPEQAEDPATAAPAVRRGWGLFRARRERAEVPAVAPAAAEPADPAWTEPQMEAQAPEPPPGPRRRLGLFGRRRADPAVPASSAPAEAGIAAYFEPEPEPAAFAGEEPAAYWPAQPVADARVEFWRGDAEPAPDPAPPEPSLTKAEAPPPEPASRPRRGWGRFGSRRPASEAAAAAAENGPEWPEPPAAGALAAAEPAATSGRRKFGLFRSRRAAPGAPTPVAASAPVMDQAGETDWPQEPGPGAFAAEEEAAAAYWSTQPLTDEPSEFWREDAGEGRDNAYPPAMPADRREATRYDGDDGRGYGSPAEWRERPAVSAGARAYVPGAAAAAARAAAEAGERNIRFDPTKERGPEYHDTARRHSRRVRLLKVALPTIAVLSVIGFLAIMSFHGDDNQPALNLSGVDFDQREIIMGTPNISGFEGTKRSYEIHAEKAVQAFGDTKVITLQTINAKFALGDDTRANLEAATGVYDSNTQKLKLSGGIKLTTTNGYTAELKDADVDVEAGNVDSSTGVSIRGEEGVITSDSIEVRDRGKHVFFRGNVKVVFTPSEKAEKPDAAGSTADAAAPETTPAPATAPAIIQAAPDGST